MRVRLTSAMFVITLACVQSLAQVEPSKTQYGIYSAFLRIQLDGQRGIDDLRVGKNGSAISPNIKPYYRKLTIQRQRELKQRLPEIESKTLESLVACSERSYQLTYHLDVPTEYKFLPPERARGGYGYLQFSCVGLNQTETQAVFQVSRLNCDCAVGKWVLMKKTPDGNWLVLREDIEWIS